jgi:hypothetical protein
MPRIRWWALLAVWVGSSINVLLLPFPISRKSHQPMRKEELMTPADEAHFIALWTAGLEITEIAQRLGIPCGTVQSRAQRLQQCGLIQPGLRAGPIPGRRRWRGRTVQGCQDGCRLTPLCRRSAGSPCAGISISPSRYARVLRPNRGPGGCRIVR